MISLVIPTYNRAKDLEITLKSILNQNFSDYEILIIDNGPSNDQTRNIINSFKDEEIKYYSTEARGVTYGRSLGNLLAKGEIIIQMDSDVSLFDPETLLKVEKIFRKTKTDILGLMELKNKEDIAELKINNLEEIKIGNNEEVGLVNNNYSITTGFEKMISWPKAIYQIDSFRSCFMAYKKEILDQLINWDINYVKVGGKMAIREETDFLFRAKLKNKKIYYTNYTAIWHREGNRDNQLGQRKRGFKKHFYYAASQVYLVLKDLMNRKKYVAIFPYLINQFFWGGYKNKGFLRVLWDNKTIVGSLANIAGFYYGLWVGFLLKPKFIKDAKEYIN